MAKFTEEEKQRILKKYRRLRTLDLLISLPILVGAFGLVLPIRNPEYHIGELHGLQVMLPAAALLAVGLLLHYRVWRCPACHRRLGRALFCRGCGALFTS